MKLRKCNNCHYSHGKDDQACYRENGPCKKRHEFWEPAEVTLGIIADSRSKKLKEVK